MDPVVAVEIGTSRTRALVGRLREDGNMMIMGVADVASRGVKKSEIIHLENAVASVRDALDRADRISNVTIHSVNLVLTGGNINWTVNRGMVPVDSSDYVITEDDVSHVLEAARAVSLPKDRDVIHSIKQQFYVDDHEGVIDPEGMEGARLSADMLILHGIRDRLKQTVRVLRNVPVEVENVAFSGLCTALAVLSPEQKENGVLVIDLGGGSTDYFVYANRTVALGGTLAIGGEHCTNDLAMGFGIPTRHAETLKVEKGSAMIDLRARTQKATLPAEESFPGVTVNVKDIQTILHARMEEIFQLVKKELDAEDLLSILGSGVVLTGGGAHMNKVLPLAEKIFGVRCIKGQPRNVGGLAIATQGPEYAATVGMLKYSAQQERRTSSGSTLSGLFRGIFGKGGM